MWVDRAATLWRLGRTSNFSFSAADKPVLPISFALGQFQRHAHDGGALKRRIAPTMALTIAPVTGTFCELEGDGAGVAYDVGPNLDLVRQGARSWQESPRRALPFGDPTTSPAPPFGSPAMMPQAGYSRPDASLAEMFCKGVVQRRGVLQARFVRHQGRGQTGAQCPRPAIALSLAG
jgi:hypothetical protein